MFSPLPVTQTISLRASEQLAATSGHEWVQWRVAKDPEENHHSQKDPDVLCGNKELRLRSSRYCGSRAEEKYQEQEWKRNDHQRIKFESCERVAVKQLMQAT